MRETGDTTYCVFYRFIPGYIRLKRMTMYNICIYMRFSIRLSLSSLCMINTLLKLPVRTSICHVIFRRPGALPGETLITATTHDRPLTNRTRRPSSVGFSRAAPRFCHLAGLAHTSHSTSRPWPAEYDTLPQPLVCHDIHSPPPPWISQA